MKNRLLVFLSLFSSVFVQTSDIFRAIQVNNSKQITQWFRSYPNIDMLNDNGQTPLIIAVQTGSKRWVKKLLKYDALVNIVDSFGKTALDYAVESKNKNIVLELTKYNAKVTSENNLEKVQKIIKRKTKKMKIVAGVFGGLGAWSMLSNCNKGELVVPIDSVAIVAGAGASASHWSKKEQEYKSEQTSMVLETKKKEPTVIKVQVVQ